MAVGLAAELKESLDLDLKMIAGAKGIFDICIGEILIYSKHKEGRFPRLGEITKLIQMSI